MLTDTAVKNLKPKAKPYKKGDAHGLFIYVTQNGTKFWRQKFRYNSKEKLLSHGEYPFVSLQKARQLRDEARQLLADGKDPSTQKKVDKLGKKNTFEAIARSWHETMSPSWSENHVQKVIVSLEKDIFGVIGDIPVMDIKTPLLVDTLKQIEKRGSFEQANRVAQRVGSVFRYAIASGLMDYDPAQHIKDTLKKSEKKNYNFISINELPDFLKALENYDGHPIVKLATEFLMLTFVRTGELRGAKWSEIDFEAKFWEIPAERMKKKRTHIVPLTDRTLEILQELRKYTGNREFVFASPTKPMNPISNNTILQALKRMGYAGKMTGHGFRHLASTTLNELGYNRDAIEIQLAHIDGSTRGVYNKAEYIEERTKLMRDWSNLIEEQNQKAAPTIK
jgi:integrase